MGLSNFFSKKETSIESDKKKAPFTLGVLKVFRLDEQSLDLVVSGKVEGTLRVGDIVSITNVGEKGRETQTVAVYAMENAQRERIFEATDIPVAVWLEDALPLGIKKSSVLHDETASQEAIRKAYVTSLGDIFIGEQAGELTSGDQAFLTIADIAEIWRIFVWYCNLNAKDETKEQHEENMNKINRLMAAVRDKLLHSVELVAVYSSKTKEPYLFSQTTKKEDGTYYCSPPMILVAPIEYENSLKQRFSDSDMYTIQRISSTDDDQRIHQFFTDAFYLNGAMGAHIIDEQTTLLAPNIITPPDYSKLEEQDIPVSNPDLMRWLLLLGQQGEQKNNEQQLIAQLYSRFLSMEMPKARFLTPVKNTHSQKTAQLLLKDKQNSLKIAVIPGKGDKEAIVFYTDWKRLREIYDESWSGLIQTMGQVVEAFDVAVNPTQTPSIGCYMTKELFTAIQDTFI